MADLAKKYSITDASQQIITGYAGREEIILRVADGSSTIWLTPNDDATDSQGLFMEAKDTLVLSGKLATLSWNAVCATGETGTIYATLEA